MLEDDRPTKNVNRPPQKSEIEQLQQNYDEARTTMINDPTDENIDEFMKSCRKLYEVQDLYRLAERLLLERAVNLKKAVQGLFN